MFRGTQTTTIHDARRRGRMSRAVKRQAKKKDVDIAFMGALLPGLTVAVAMLAMFPTTIGPSWPGVAKRTGSGASWGAAGAAGARANDR